MIDHQTAKNAVRGLRMSMAALTACTALLACAGPASSPAAQPEHQESTEAPDSTATLQTAVFNPGAESLFPVTSVLVTGPSEALLVDAQFQKNDAETLVAMIQESGKELTTVYISHKDPDFYFGLNVIKNAFPEVEILASPTTREGISKSMDAKLAHWGPILGENAPTELILPEALEGNVLYVDDQPIEIVGLDGHDPKHTFLWAPSLKMVFGGVVVFDNMHAFIADSQSKEERADWYKTLDVIDALNPARVVPGHYLGKSNQDTSSVEFNRQYLKDFEAAAEGSKTSDELIATMKEKYPSIGGDSILGLSAKVIVGEMEWN